MKIYNTTVDSSLFFSKHDSTDIRLGDCAHHFTNTTDLANTDLVIWGYPDDDGIKLNGGRPGAALAPQTIRQFFYKMTPHPQTVLNGYKIKIIDAGDLQQANESLARRHEMGSHVSHWACSQALPWVSLGGGHDYGFADGDGFLKYHLEQSNNHTKPLVINFDAHLDVRPVADQKFHSGTPFRRLLEKYKNHFELIEVGMQPQCNSAHHWQWAEAQGVEIFSLEKTQNHGLLNLLKKHLSPDINRPVWISLDIDAIVSSEAPGCSQSWGQGLKTEDLIAAYKWLYEHFQWKSFSIYEVSPVLDTDNRTSKLAALFMHHFLTWNSKKNASLT